MLENKYDFEKKRKNVEAFSGGEGSCDGPFQAVPAGVAAMR